MTETFGDRATFAVEPGEITTPSLRVVDLWAGGIWLTTDDHTAFLPSFLHYMRMDGDRVRQRAIPPCPFPGRTPEEIFHRLEADRTEFREQFWFMRWSEMLDPVSMYAYLDDDLVIVFRFRRTNHRYPDQLGRTFVARIPPDDFADTVEQAADMLKAASDNQRRP
jgi:hypothetical protein